MLALALGISVASAQLFGVSMALGAFLAGLVVGRSEFSVRAASEALPMRDAFAVLFFVSVGMLLDPTFVVTQPLLILSALAVVLIGKPVVALVLVSVWGYPIGVGLRIAVALAQIGEFSFIVAALGAQLGLVTVDLRNTLVATAIVSIAVNPLLYRAVAPIERWVAKRRPARAIHDEHVDSVPSDPRHRAVVIGYGPVGRTVSRLLRENDVTPTVVDLNIETIQALRAEGRAAIYGDASQRETLVSAGVPNAGAIILSVAGLPGEGSHPNGPRVEPLRSSSWRVPPTFASSSRSSPPAPTSFMPAKARSHWRSPRPSSAAWAPRPSRYDRERARVHEEILAQA